MFIDNNGYEVTTFADSIQRADRKPANDLWSNPIKIYSKDQRLARKRYELTITSIVPHSHQPDSLFEKYGDDALQVNVQACCMSINDAPVKNLEATSPRNQNCLFIQFSLVVTNTSTGEVLVKKSDDGALFDWRVTLMDLAAPRHKELSSKCIRVCNQFQTNLTIESDGHTPLLRGDGSQWRLRGGKGEPIFSFQTGYKVLFINTNPRVRSGFLLPKDEYMKSASEDENILTVSSRSYIVPKPLISRPVPAPKIRGRKTADLLATEDRETTISLALKKSGVA